MEILYNILMVLFVIIAVVLAVLVMLQEGKSSGLSGAVGGGSGDTYWGKNKANSMEGMLQKITTVLVVLFFVLAILLNSKLF